MNYNIVSIELFVKQIKLFQSSDNTALPQRSNMNVVDSNFNARQINRKLYSKSKTNFVNEVICNNYDNNYGWYFFFNYKNKEINFFYIGKATDIRRRLDDHFRTFDYHFYSLAFPENMGQYKSDCFRFYAEGQYSKKTETYTRQFEALKTTPFTHVAWVSKTSIDEQELDQIESHFINEFIPPANGNKKNIAPSNKYLNDYLIVKEHLLSHIHKTH